MRENAYLCPSAGSWPESDTQDYRVVKKPWIRTWNCLQTGYFWQSFRSRILNLSTNGSRVRYTNGHTKHSRVIWGFLTFLSVTVLLCSSQIIFLAKTKNLWNPENSMSQLILSMSLEFYLNEFPKLHWIHRYLVNHYKIQNGYGYH